MKCKFLTSELAKKALLPAMIVALSACASNKAEDDGANAAAEEPTTIATAIDDAEEAAVETVEEAVNLENVFYFDFDQSTLSSASRAALDAQANVLRNNSNAVRLEGHADERGSREYNLALGERRAKAVADYLAIQGVARSRIEVVSYGEERPVSLGSDETSYAANRRVELK